jgi:hypothetical protein
VLQYIAQVAPVSKNLERAYQWGVQKVLKIVHNALPPKALFKLHEAGMRQIQDIHSTCTCALYRSASATVSGWKDWKDELDKARVYYGPMINLSTRPTKIDNPWWSRPAIVDDYALLDTNMIREALELVSVGPRGQRQLQSHFASALNARNNIIPLSGLLLPRIKRYIGNASSDPSAIQCMDRALL